MKSVQWLLATLGIFMGMCCLFIAATTFSSPTWFPAAARELMLTWGPILCISVVAATGLALFFPDLFSLGPTPMKRVRTTALMLVLVAGAALLH